MALTVRRSSGNERTRIMKSQHGLMSLLGCLLLVVALALAQGSTLGQEETVQEQFASFVARFGKTYADDRDEYARRLAIFSHNLARIAERNANSEVRARTFSIE
jgi:hypothetical protein